MKKILITGGAGFIGSAVIKHLQEFNYEIFVIDNVSSDNTVSLVKDLKVKLFIKPDLTVGGLRNFGAKMAIGDILVFLDADVVLTENWVNNFHMADEIIRKNPYTITGSRCKISKDNGWIERCWFKPLLSENLSHMNSGHLITSKKLFERLGGFSEELVADEDPDFGMRAKKIGAKIIDINELEVIHQRYPKTLKQFFFREIWHGKGQYQEGILSSRTGIITIIFFFLHICFIFLTCSRAFAVSFVVFLLIVFTCFYSSKVKYRNPSSLVFINTYLYYYYYLARSSAFLVCMLFPRLIVKKRNIETDRDK